MNILIITPNPIDTTSFYRAWGVFPYLSRRMDGLNLITDKNRQMTWADIAQMDLVYMHRPFALEHLKFAQYVKEMKIPLWMDYDDDLTSIPEWMSFYQTYMTEQTQKIIATLIGLADVLTVSTQALKDRFQSLNKAITIIPNALNDFIFDTNPMPYNANKIMMWRGSETHHVDLLTFSETIKKSVNKEDWEWQYFGYNPWFLPKTRHIPTMDPIMYFRSIRSINPGVMFVPLVDDTFNRCKSNINWLEATYAGSVCLVPEFESWDVRGVFRYATIAEFSALLEFLMSPESILLRKSHYLASWEHIKDNYLLSVVNGKRKAIIKQLVK